MRFEFEARSVDGSVTRNAPPGTLATGRTTARDSTKPLPIRHRWIRGGFFVSTVLRRTEMPHAVRGPYAAPSRVAARVALAALLLVALPVAATGQAIPPTLPVPGAPSQADTFHLPGIVVTASGAATPRAQLPQSVTVLEGADLRSRGVVFLLDALEEVPGVQVVRTGSIGATTSVFLRGGNSNFVKVMLDGVPLNEPGGRFDFGTFTLQNIERIEVVRGPSSVLYGSDAVSGVIHLFTRRGEGEQPEVRGSAAFQAGSLGSWSAEAGARGSSERSAWSLSLGRTESDGFLPVNNRFTSLVGSGRLALRPDDRTRVALAVRIQESRYHFPTDGSGEIVDLNQFTFDDGVTLSLEGTRAMAPGLEGRILLRAGRAERGAHDEPDTPADTVGFSYSGERLGTTTRRGADARLTWRGARVQAIGGLDWEVERERMQARTESNFGGGPTVSASSFGQDRWNVAGYGRIEMAGPAASRLSAGVRADRNEVFGGFLTGQAGVVVPVGSLGRLRGSMGSAYKVPTFIQQFGATAFERGNPELSPETSRNIEAGWDGGFLDNRVLLGAGVFRQAFRRLIEYENRGASEPTYFNEARARATGFEAHASWRPAPGFVGGAEYTAIDARAVVGDPADLVDGGAPRLLRRPARQVTGHLRAPLPNGPAGATVGLAVTHVGSRADNDFSTFPSTRVTLPSYTTGDLDVQLPLGGPGAAHDAASTFLLTLRVENLTNTAYTSVVGFPGKGRMAFVGIRWNP
jgi:vitamin B12 transporter